MWRKEEKMNCLKCGAVIPDNSKFCLECGTSVTSQGNNAVSNQDNLIRRSTYEGEIHKCPNCGDVVNSFMVKCSSCGYELSGTKASSAL